MPDMERRKLLGGIGVAGGLMGVAPMLGTLNAVAAPAAEIPAGGSTLSRFQINPGPKEPVRNKRAAVSADNLIVTEAMVRILALGGNAVDAAIAGCLVQAVVEPYMTNHTGTVTMLMWRAADRSIHQLDSGGTFPSGLPPFKPIPAMPSSYGAYPPSACIPGFMPGLKAMYGKFATLPWAELCRDAVRWAESGHEVTSFEYGVNLWGLDFTTYTAEGRDFYMPNGHLPMVGEIFQTPAMAETLRQVSAQGPDYMITGPWAEKFVALGNRLGWRITLDHMTETPPRWIKPLRAPVAGLEIAGLAPPQRQGLHTLMMLGILDALKVRDMAPDSAERHYFMAQALRWVERELGYINDPDFYHVPTAALLESRYHAQIARILKDSLPKVDLLDHVRLTAPDMVMRGAVPLSTAGLPAAKPGDFAQKQPPGSCELSVVDAEGNWVQMMNTLQSGGIPGYVVDGIPMVGSHAGFGMPGMPLDTRLTAGYRMRSIMGNTIVLKGGRPVFSLGTPGRPNYTVAQVLTNYALHGMSPVAAVDAPRLLPLTEDGALVIEDRLPKETIRALYGMGLPVRVAHPYDWHMGSFQVCWRDEQGYGAYADPRRCGVAAGI